MRFMSIEIRPAKKCNRLFQPRDRENKKSRRRVACGVEAMN